MEETAPTTETSQEATAGNIGSTAATGSRTTFVSDCGLRLPATKNEAENQTMPYL